MLRGIAGEEGINSMRVNLVHKREKSRFEEQISFRFLIHNLKVQVCSESILPLCRRGMKALFIFLRKC